LAPVEEADLEGAEVVDELDRLVAGLQLQPEAAGRQLAEQDRLRGCVSRGRGRLRQQPQIELKILVTGMIRGQFSVIFANFRRKNWRFSQKPML
jgi:hypothetical protein